MTAKISSLSALSPSPAGEVSILTETHEKFSPRAGLIYKPKENVSVYGSFSQTFLPRTGEQFAGLRRSSPGSVQSDILSPEPGLSFTAAVFRNEATRAQRSDANAEETEVQGLSVEGFELQLEGEIYDNLYLRAGYSNLTGEASEDGVRPRELPKNTFSIWSNYQVTDQLGVGLGATHQDKALTGNGSATFLPAFTRFDALSVNPI